MYQIMILRQSKTNISMKGKVKRLLLKKNKYVKKDK